MERCFVIQPFDKGPYDKRYEEILKPAILDADLEPYRVDQDPGVSVVMDSIEEGIRQSDACLVDITTNNPNVWFELGYALALGKGVVPISSKERGEKYPFDIQNRHIIEYTPESLSDFAKLKAEITDRLKAIVARQAELQNIASMSPLKETHGLSPHEMAALTIIMAGTVSSLTFPASAVEHQMENAGFTPVAVNLSLQSLNLKGMVKAVEETDTDVVFGTGTHQYRAYCVTEKGTSWLLENQERLVLRIQQQD